MRFLLLFLLAAPCHAEEPIEIPLSEIWALDMPGAHNVYELAPEDARREFNELLKEVKQQLYKLPRDGSAMPEAFAYAGGPARGPQLLLDRLRNKTTAKSVVTQGDPIFVMIFSGNDVRYFRFAGAAWKENTLEIMCEFIPHRTRNESVHFAILPIGNLPPGTYSLTFKHKPLPATSPYADSEPGGPLLLKVVCQPSTLQVVDSVVEQE